MGKSNSADFISSEFPITSEEYEVLNTKYGSLCEFAAWQLFKKNAKNNHTDEQADIAQDLRIALLRAGSYYKRQIYIERCLELCDMHVKDGFLKLIIQELKYLWQNKTRHGASRQKFGPHHEKLLFNLAKKIIPTKKMPRRDAPLLVDNKFNTYCKAITWNAQKALGKKITREKSIRQGQVSINEYSYLGGR